jgi:MFS transporter, PAT family, beta-lactamase induction signal transducer AmpG
VAGAPLERRHLKQVKLGNLLHTRSGRAWYFAVLYATEGAPMGFIWWALPTLLAKLDVPVATITAVTAAATLPWIFKFLAGPLVDGSQRRGVRLRTWILSCQSAMVVSLAALACFDWPDQIAVLTACLVVHGVFAAVQDVAIDSLAIRTVPVAELGRINGWMQAGMLTGRATVAAGAIALADRLGPAGPVVVVAVVVAVPMLLVAIATVEPTPTTGPIPGWRDWLRTVTAPAAVLGIGIALVAGSGFEFLGVVLGPLLLSVGASDGQVAALFGLVAPLSLIAGAVVSGYATDRLAPRRGTAIGVLTIALLVGGLGAGMWSGHRPGPGPMLGFAAAIYVSIGFFTTASYALFMRIARGGLSATRFSIFMAMTNACEAWAAFAGGRLEGVLGYGGALLILVGLSLLSLPMLARLRIEGRAEPGCQRFEDRRQPLDGGVRSADHQAVAALESEHATTHADVEVVDAVRGERGRTVDVVAVPRVAAVDDRVAGVEQRCERVDGRADEGGGHHDPDRPRGFHGGHQLAQGSSAGDGQHLAELDAPLVEAVDAPDHALHEHLVLVEGDQLAEHRRRQLGQQDRGGRPVARERPVGHELLGDALGSRTSSAVRPKASASVWAKQVGHEQVVVVAARAGGRWAGRSR